MSKSATKQHKTDTRKHSHKNSFDSTDWIVARRAAHPKEPVQQQISVPRDRSVKLPFKDALDDHCGH